MKAEERAKAVVALLQSDFGQSGEDVWFFAIRDELRAHANEALERLEKTIEEERKKVIPPDDAWERGYRRACEHITVAARALKE